MPEIELKHSKVTIEKGRKYNRNIEIPVWMLPTELQKLHEKLQDARLSVRELEHDFRRLLSGYLSGLKESHTKYPTLDDYVNSGKPL